MSLATVALNTASNHTQTGKADFCDPGLHANVDPASGATFMDQDATKMEIHCENRWVTTVMAMLMLYLIYHPYTTSE